MDSCYGPCVALIDMQAHCPAPVPVETEIGQVALFSTHNEPLCVGVWRLQSVCDNATNGLPPAVSNWAIVVPPIRIAIVAPAGVFRQTPIPEQESISNLDVPALSVTLNIAPPPLPASPDTLAPAVCKDRGAFILEPK